MLWAGEDGEGDYLRPAEGADHQASKRAKDQLYQRGSSSLVHLERLIVISYGLNM